ncbi:spore germination protein [Brevibacillus dissolubilis]|uniref:spore germination protein n=1 Tax=Brevibacillus dissolubilis TaxID=1844116 RepID=UPI0011170F1C|nr:spore germination protein [Brevibacillus dissolubilis]
MIARPEERITTPQAAVIVINYILGVTFLTLPRVTVEAVKTPDVWITVILGGLITMIAGVIMVKLSQRYPEKTFYQYSQEIAGKWVGGLLSLFTIIYFFSSSAYDARMLVEVTSYFLLEGTPSWALLMPFMWVGLYLIMGGINPIARLYEIIFPITLVIFTLVFFISFQIFEVDNLRPVLGLGVAPVLQGTKSTVLAYTGVEIMLIILAFMKQPNKAVQAVLIGTAVPMLFYVMTVVIVIGALSIDGVITRTWPTIDLIRSLEITGLLFERFESFFLVIWIMQIFSTFTITYYAAALGLAQLFQKDIHRCMFYLLPVIYIIAMTPKNINDLFTFADLVGDTALYLFGLLPLILLIVSRLKEGKHEAKL